MLEYVDYGFRHYMRQGLEDAAATPLIDKAQLQAIPLPSQVSLSCPGDTR
ncbi:hypothetical protein UNDYM_5876 [Undibacterium sp. YM2]|nr:hypothetical protein [Undibacterium sp. YM2]BBB70129.1 hypothetical protein UNDYM_5876 [Undibacterium sp. YM2]